MFSRRFCSARGSLLLCALFLLAVHLFSSAPSVALAQEQNELEDVESPVGLEQAEDEELSGAASEETLSVAESKGAGAGGGSINRPASLCGAGHLRRRRRPPDESSSLGTRMSSRARRY